MNKLKKSIFLFIILTLILGFNSASKAENETEFDNNETYYETESDTSINLENFSKEAENELNNRIDEESINDGNFFKTSKDSFTLEQDIDGDVFILCGGKVTIDSYISGNAYVCAKELEITNNAEISTSLYCVAQEITIDGEISLNAYCASKEFSLKENSHVYKNLYLTAENISLDGLVENNASISGNTIEIKSNCLINGNLSYSAPNEINIPENIVSGTVNFSNNSINIAERTMSDELSDGIKSIISYTLFAIIIFLILNGIKAKVLDITDFKSNIGKYVLFGLLILFILPILNIIILIIPFLSRFAFIVLGIYILLLMLASSITIISISKMCAEKYKESIQINDILRTILFIALFSFAYKLVKFIPVIGFLGTLVVVVLGIGMAFTRVLPKKEVGN